MKCGPKMTMNDPHKIECWGFASPRLAVGQLHALSTVRQCLTRNVQAVQAAAVVTWMKQTRVAKCEKMSKIYDLLNDQSELQELIRYYYYVSLIPEQRVKANHKLVIGELDRAFTNCRLHMVEVIGEYDEDGIIDFMVTMAPVAYNKCDFKYVFKFYGDDWHDYYSYEYLDPDYNDLFSESDDDEDM